ncbi:MAG: hypothetical protein QNJ41_15760 [Xenococcaceae cyanobacterium MO_188.B32]|nr:hypothetical protein [Xenococcaceae cyanobacterium MO_188.B32]
MQFNKALTPLVKTKQALREHLPNIAVSLYNRWKYNYFNVTRTYEYNLSTLVERKPRDIIDSLLTTTKKLVTPKKRILFYPDFPYKKATLYQICLFLGYDVTNDPQRKFDLAIKWQRYATFFENDTVLSKLSRQNNNIINFNCQDVSKEYTNKIFKQVFGYELGVDPRSYTGKCVAKSNLNAQHDGKIIDCPITKIEAGVVYQKLVDNEVQENAVLDYRVPIFKQEIPLVYKYLKKNQTKEQRFYGYPSLLSVELAETEEVFSQDEINKIISFCENMGLDYGELDILRDKQDQRIYIVDANNTPSSRLLFEPVERPYKECILSFEQRQIVLQKLAQTFQSQLLNNK